MSREDFLQGLERALEGSIPAPMVREQLRYYEGYIRTELERGRSEQDIMEELGDPRLIARTILDTTPGAAEGAYEDAGSGYAPYQSREEGQQSQERRSGRIHVYDLSKWYWKLIGIIVAACVLMLVFTIVAGLFSLFISLLPVIAAVALVMWIVGGFRR